MKKILKKGFGGFFFALILAIELAVLVDLVTVWLGHPLPRKVWLIGAGALFLLLALLPVRRRRLQDDVGTLLVIFAVCLLGSRGLLLYLERSGPYTAIDTGKSALYAGHRVLVTVERPGDEVRLSGGVLESFLRYGSEVYVNVSGAQDAAEAETVRAAAAALGIQADRVLFTESGTALERVRPDVVLAAYGEGAALSAALSGLREADGGYRPLMLTGLLDDAAPADFYRANLAAAAKPGTAALSGRSWDTRLRLPVDPAGLSHSLLSCTDYTLLSLYGEEAAASAESVVNGDRVFWPFSGDAALQPGYVKLANSDGDFLYDYYIDPLGKETFTICTEGAADQAYRVSAEGEHCSAKLGQGRTVTVTCPKGRRCIVTVTSDDGRFWDTVLISNPGRFPRETAQGLEQILRHFWEQVLPASNSFALGTQGWEWLRTKLPQKG